MEAEIFSTNRILLLRLSEQGKWKNCKRYSLLSDLLKVLFHYHSLLLSIRHLSQDKRRKLSQRNCSTWSWYKAQDTRENTKESYGGNPTGSAVKKNGREGTRQSGSSKGGPELGLANDSWNCQRKKYIYYRRMPCSIGPILGWPVENCIVTMWHHASAQHLAQRGYRTERFNKKSRSKAASLCHQMVNILNDQNSEKCRNCILPVVWSINNQAARHACEQRKDEVLEATNNE